MLQGICMAGWRLLARRGEDAEIRNLFASMTLRWGCGRRRRVVQRGKHRRSPCGDQNGQIECASAVNRVVVPRATSRRPDGGFLLRGPSANIPPSGERSNDRNGLTVAACLAVARHVRPCQLMCRWLSFPAEHDRAVVRDSDARRPGAPMPKASASGNSSPGTRVRRRRTAVL